MNDIQSRKRKAAVRRSCQSLYAKAMEPIEYIVPIDCSISNSKWQPGGFAAMVATRAIRTTLALDLRTSSILALGRAASRSSAPPVSSTTVLDDLNVALAMD